MSSDARPVLVAEDEESDAFMLRLAWERAGLTRRLMVVGDGREVVDYLSGSGTYADRSTHPLPALLVLDLKMPRMTGFEVLAWLADHPSLKGLPTAVLSSSSDESDIRKARQLGAREYFTKPHRLEELVSIVRRLDFQSWDESPSHP